MNTCVGFKCPALLPLQGWDKSRDGDWLELVLLPEPGKDEPQQDPKLSYFTLAWFSTLHETALCKCWDVAEPGRGPHGQHSPPRCQTPPVLPSQTQHTPHLQPWGCLAARAVSSVGLFKGEIKCFYKSILQPASGTVLPLLPFT